MKHCRIKVNGLTYDGLYASTCDAIADALERFPNARGISAKVIA